MTRLAIWMAFIYGETNIIFQIERAITTDRDFMVLSNSARRTRFRLCRRKEGITTLCAEEVLFVISPLSQRRIVKRNEPFVDDRRLTVEALRREELP